MNIITIVKIKQIFIALFKLILYLKQVPLPGFARTNLIYPDTAHDAAIRRSYDILANSGYHKGGAAITLSCIRQELFTGYSAYGYNHAYHQGNCAHSAKGDKRNMFILPVPPPFL